MYHNGFLKVATSSPKVTVGDPMANVEVMLKALQVAQDHEAGILVFPELSICGYTCGDLLFQTYLLQDVNEAIKTLLENNPFDGVLTVGAPISIQRNLYNCAIVIQKNQILGIIPKRYLPNDMEFYEERWFTRGYEIVKHYDEIEFLGRKVPFGDLIFENNEHNVSFGVEICQDLWVPSSPSQRLALNGADIILNLSTSNEVYQKNHLRRDLVRIQSLKLVAGYIYCSSGVYESTTDGVFGGHSMVSQNGTLLAESNIFSREELNVMFADLDISKIQFDRRRSSSFRQSAEDNMTYLKHVTFELVNCPTYKFEQSIDPTPFVPKKEEKEAFEEMMNIQMAGLAKRMEHTKAQTLLIGVSGGLDSTLALLLAAKTFDLIHMPRQNIIAYTIRGFGTSNRTNTNANQLMKTLGVTHHDIDLRESVLAHFETIGHDPNVVDITYENAQARERTNILMNLANKMNGLVLGTGNMSELALGWCTYNGDQMSNYAINAGIPKTLVKFMVKQFMLRETKNLTTNEEDAQLLQYTLGDILDTPISPELINTEQHTEEIIGKYEVHDFILYHMLNNGDTEDRIYALMKEAFKGEFEEEKLLEYLQIFFRRFYSQQFKRSAMPDGPKVLDVSLSPRTDWRMPSDASYRNRL
ncbi:NAD(+) synthase [Turicibacter sp. TJ11]|uniref:NAD(+) synthase n=1 Tax=Turicibacter sp. TJ11 TaxID=2806443 RepID=UPI001F230635|nr:NAD(+) synthase [Turicibacter sp. TJ11]